MHISLESRVFMLRAARAYGRMTMRAATAYGHITRITCVDLKRGVEAVGVEACARRGDVGGLEVCGRKRCARRS